MFTKRGLWLPVLALALLLGGCSQQDGGTVSQTAALDLPDIHDDATVNQYSDLGNTAYQLLDEGKTAEAVAAFTEQHTLIPEGKWGAFNVACAHGRAGNVDEGIEWLTKAVDNGWDAVEHFDSDPDLESLRSDARYGDLSDKVRANFEKGMAPFAHGLPAPSTLPKGLETEAAVKTWSTATMKMLRTNRKVWQNTEYMAAYVDHRARRLALLEQINKDNPHYDAALERISTLASAKSVYESWGTMSDGVIKEVGEYLAGNPSTEGRSSANYYAGLAAYNRDHPETADHPSWSRTAAETRSFLQKVESGTEHEGNAAAYLLYLDLVEAEENSAPVRSKVTAFVETFAENKSARRAAARLFQDKMVAALWPIPLEATDIDGNAVSLTQYRGRVVLVDFWATWCGPCRAELPELTRVFETYHDEGFDVLSVSLDYPDKTTVDEYRAWITEKAMNWRHIYDGQAWESPLPRAFMVTGIPNPILVGRDGSMEAMGEACRGENLEETVRKALRREDVSGL